MSYSNGQVGDSAAFKPFTKAERIQQLNGIDKGITTLLQSAGLALKTLTASQTSPGPSLTDRREAFESAANSYFKTLQVVDVGLRRHIIALEEADIITAEKSKGKAKESQDPLARPGAGTEQTPGDGGMGKLDIGWLNSRSGRVGRDMEAELWQETRKFLEGIESEKKERTSKDRALGDNENMVG